MGVSLTDIFGGSLLKGVNDLISQFHMSPEEKAELQAKIQAQADVVRQAENDYNAKLNEIAGMNIRAEAQSGDKFTERARPAVIWVGLAMFAWNYCLVPTFGAHWHMPSLEIPSSFSEAWGIVVTGYVFTRTADKALSLPGESNIKLPFGIQLSNNGGK